MGYQFENLVLENRKYLWEMLKISAKDIIFDNPYFQRKTLLMEACQIDYLIQTKFKTYYLFEFKFSRDPVKYKVINEVKQKIVRLKLGRGVACLPILIHVNGVADRIIEEDFFYRIIDFKDLL